MILTKPEIILQPYGASSGTVGVKFELSASNPEVPTKEPQSFIDELKEAITEDQYESLLLGELHLSISGKDGEDPADPSISKELTKVLELLSKESLEYQVKTLKRTSEALRPPFLELHVPGKTFTGRDEFYENFNYVVCSPALSTSVAGKGKEAKERYHSFALVEISKHRFSSFIFRISSPEDWEEIEKDFLKTQCITVQKQRIFLIPEEGADINIARNMAIEHGVRFGVDLRIL